MWLLYQALLAVATLLAGPFLLIQRGRHYLTSVGARLGRVPTAPGPLPWLHAVSVGEVNAAAGLVPLLAGDGQVLVTTITPSGQENARGRFPGALVTYLPFELSFAVRRFFERLRPSALVLCEGDLWPLVLREASRRSIPIVIVNGRVSERSFRRMRLLRRFLEPILGPVDAFAVQTTEDRRRLVDLGVDPEKIVVTGNLKFEAAPAPALPGLESALLSQAGGRPILVAGSTMRGEEEVVLDAFQAAGGGERALLVLAPRHPERWPRVAGLLRKRGIASVLRSELEERTPAGGTEVVLLDSLGELASIYRLGRSAFIGGTLVPTGGHNPLEAARDGVAIASGPSMHNFLEIADRFDADRAWFRVEDATELGALWKRLIDQPELAAEVGARGRDVVEANRGALERTRAFLATHVGQVPGR